MVNECNCENCECIELVNPTTDEMVKWAEQAYETSIDDLPTFINNIIESYAHTDMSKVNIINVAMTCLLKNLFFNETLNMSEDSVLYAKYQIIRMLFPEEYGFGAFSVMKWNELLNPTAEDYFKVIPFELWNEIKKEAQLLLDAEEKEPGKHDPKFVKHWQALICDELPFGFKLPEQKEPDNEQ